MIPILRENRFLLFLSSVAAMIIGLRLELIFRVLAMNLLCVILGVVSLTLSSVCRSSFGGVEQWLALAFCLGLMPVRFRPPHPFGGGLTRRIRFRVLVIALGLVLFAVSAAALFMTGDFSDPSLSGLIYTIEPDVMPLAIQTVGSDWLYTGDNLGLMYRDGEYSLVGGSWISANAFSVKETVPLASGGSSAWTVADVSSALSRMQTISSYLMGSTGVIGYSLYWPSGGEISFNSQSVGDILSRFASFQTLGTSNIYSRLAGLMGTSGSISTTYQTIGTSQPVSGTSSSLGDLLSSFMSSSTRNQYILGNYLMSASGEMPVTVFSGDSGSTSYTATSLSALISYVSADYG